MGSRVGGNGDLKELAEDRAKRSGDEPAPAPALASTGGSQKLEYADSEGYEKGEIVLSYHPRRTRPRPIQVPR